MENIWKTKTYGKHMEYGLYLENMLRSNHLYSSMVYAAMIFTPMQMRNRHRFARVELDAMNGLMDSYGSCHGDDGIYRHFKGKSMLVPYPWDQCWSSHAAGIRGMDDHVALGVGKPPMCSPWHIWKICRTSRGNTTIYANIFFISHHHFEKSVEYAEKETSGESNK